MGIGSDKGGVGVGGLQTSVRGYVSQMFSSFHFIMDIFLHILPLA